MRGVHRAEQYISRHHSHNLSAHSSIVLRQNTLLRNRLFPPGWLGFSLYTASPSWASLPNASFHHDSSPFFLPYNNTNNCKVQLDNQAVVEYFISFMLLLIATLFNSPLPFVHNHLLKISELRIFPISLGDMVLNSMNDFSPYYFVSLPTLKTQYQPDIGPFHLLDLVKTIS